MELLEYYPALQSRTLMDLWSQQHPEQCRQHAACKVHEIIVDEGKASHEHVWAASRISLALGKNRRRARRASRFAADLLPAVPDRVLSLDRYPEKAVQQ